MHCLVGIDDTDSSRGFCTTYLGYRIAADLSDVLEVLPFPRLVRLNPNIPFKTRGNAAVCLLIDAPDPDRAFARLSAKVSELSDVEGGANTGMVFLDDPGVARSFDRLYSDALCGVVNPHRARRTIAEAGARSFELGNGMGLVGAASALAFDERYDHTYELISYRLPERFGTMRKLDPDSVFRMDSETFPRTLNNVDHQKRKVLISPHGPDPVLAGVRGDSPDTVLGAFRSLVLDEDPQGHMVYVSNQHTDAHLERKLDWKAYSSGWDEGEVVGVDVGQGGHTYVSINCAGTRRLCSAYEPTGDLRRAAKLLKPGDRLRVYGGVRRATKLHSKTLNLETFEVLASAKGGLPRGTYISSPRANRHLTKPLSRYGREAPSYLPNVPEGWLSRPVMAPVPA
ncbi:MAG: DUF1743 domain-containing protein [archaeon]|nr:MAG: DUF1743 domain-containing protein [archaeon]